MKPTHQKTIRKNRLPVLVADEKHQGSSVNPAWKYLHAIFNAREPALEAAHV